MSIIYQKMSNYFIGIMTGTSADALDGCIVSFDEGFKFVESTSIPLDGDYKKNYEACIKAGYKTSSESNLLAEIEQTLNTQTIKLIKTLIDNTNINVSKISLIGFSGQTVFHNNERSYQIGDPLFIAKETKINVCSDFRNFDIKHGGIGAPLIPAFHDYLFSEDNKSKIVFNIGGIANGTFLKDGDIVLASDVGPGNCLIDFVMFKRFNKPFDDKGEDASKGEINQELLNELRSSCSDMHYPRADDKRCYYDLINSSFYEIQSNSVLRTLTEFTAEKIIEFYKFCNEPDEVIVHGGGTKNLYLMELIKNNIAGTLKTTEDKIPSKFVEAAGFAYLAYLNKGEMFLAK